MKKFTLGIIAAMVVFAAFSFRFYTPYEATNRTAEVEVIEGMGVFTDCKPVQAYDYLGTVKDSRAIGSMQYQPTRDKLIKAAKKEYPDADGIIMIFRQGTERADAIKFK